MYTSAVLHKEITDFVHVYEFPKNLNISADTLIEGPQIGGFSNEETKNEEEEMKVDEQSCADTFQNPLAFDSKFGNRLVFKDENVTIYPMESVSEKSGRSCFSFICVPNQARAKLLPKKATELGCNPKLHFKILTAG